MKEERKIQQTGNAYTIYLPSKWVAENSLQRGSPLFVYQSEGALVLSPAKREEKRSVSIVAAEEGEALHEVISAYIAGASEIIVNGKSAFSVASDARNRLSGVEVVEESTEGSKLKVFVDAEDVSQKELLKRMNLVVLSMRNLVLDGMREGKMPDKVELERRDDNVDRLYLMLLRVAYQSRASFEAVSNALAAKAIERACDHMQKIGSEKLPQKPGGRNSLEEVFENSCEIYEKSFKSYLEQSAPHKVCVARSEFKKKHLLPKKEEELGKLLEHCKRIVDYASDIAEITGDMIEYGRMTGKE